jgi:hypothetical protein
MGYRYATEMYQSAGASCHRNDWQNQHNPWYGLIFARNICVRLRICVYDFALLGLSRQRFATPTGRMSQVLGVLGAVCARSLH